MSNRGDILKDKLVYTEKLGWIDLGHADGSDAKALMAALNDVDTRKESFSTVVYTQYMGMGLKYGTSIITKWKVRRGLSEQDKKRVALTIMMHTSMLFEDHQGMFPFTLKTDSSFSGEDLVSNLFGFYKAVDDIDYLPLMNPVSQESALRRWDYYGEIGSWKNKTFRPWIFPEPNLDVNLLLPYLGDLPACLNTIEPIDIRSSSILIHVEDRTGINIDHTRTLKIGLE